MKINTETNNFYTTQRAQSSTAANTNAASFASALAATTAGVAKQADFTSMTRKEMFDWMNGQIRSGKMSLDESSPFLGMTMKVSVATGKQVDMSTDTTRINFIEKARLGIEGALLNNNPDLAKSLQTAIDVMHRHQGWTFSSFS